MKLIATCESGIADRVRVMLFGYDLASRHGWDYQFYWPVNEHCAAPFEDIFQTNRFEVVKDEPYPEVPTLTFGTLSAKTLRQVLAMQTWDVVKFRSYVTEFPHEHWQKTVKFSAEVYEKSSEFWGTFLTTPVTGAFGIHIRDGRPNHNCPPIHYYLDKLALNWDGANMLLTTDVGGAFEAIRRFYPLCERYPSRSLSRSTREGVIDAAIELALLCRCKTLVLPTYSGFSRLAALPVVITEPWESGLCVVRK